MQVAPAVRVAIDEALGKPPGSVSTGQLVAALRALGFDFVFDTLFGADLTVVEEGAELLERLAGHLLAAKSAREAEAAGAAAAAAAAVPPPPMPMFTSCCPGWVAMVEKSNPELIPYLSSCKVREQKRKRERQNDFCSSTTPSSFPPPAGRRLRFDNETNRKPNLQQKKRQRNKLQSPQMMMGAVIKNYFAAAAGKSPDEIVSVSLMPCIRKQGEADRPWFATAAGGGGDAAARDVDRPSFAAKGLARDVDHVITTVELARILRDKGVDPEALSESEFDAPLGEGSGGAQLFGTTGGVMEAALRTVAERVTGEAMPGLVYAGVRGLEGVREATVSLQPGKGTPFYELLMPPAPPAGAARGDGAPAPDAPPPPPPPPPLQIRVAVANGLGNAKKLVKAMADGAARYDFVEVMACPGGCIGGGGQPRSADRLVGQRRQAAIYALDEKKAIRRPHDNALVKRLYADFLGGKAGSRKAHELLHTHYVKGGPEEGGGGGGGGGAD